MSESYRAGFHDGFVDYMGAQARHDWSAGFQHGFQFAQKRMTCDLSSCTDSNDGFVGHDPVWDEHPGIPTRAIPLDGMEQRLRTPSGVIDQSGDPRPNAMITPSVAEDGDPLPAVRPNRPLDARPSRPMQPIPPDSQNDDPTTSESPFRDDPEPAREPQPADPPRGDPGELNFDDLFVDPDDTSSARPLPAATLRRLSQREAPTQESLKLKLRFKNDELTAVDPPMAAAQVRQAVVVPEDLQARAHPASYQVETPAANKQRIADRRSTRGGQVKPQRELSGLFQNQTPTQRMPRSYGQTEWDRQFRVDQTQPIVFDDPIDED